MLGNLHDHFQLEQHTHSLGRRLSRASNADASAYVSPSEPPAVHPDVGAVT